MKPKNKKQLHDALIFKKWVNDTKLLVFEAEPTAKLWEALELSADWTQEALETFEGSSINMGNAHLAIKEVSSITAMLRPIIHYETISFITWQERSKKVLPLMFDDNNLKHIISQISMKFIFFQKKIY